MRLTRRGTLDSYRNLTRRPLAHLSLAPAIVRTLSCSPEASSTFCACKINRNRSRDLNIAVRGCTNDRIRPLTKPHQGAGVDEGASTSSIGGGSPVGGGNSAQDSM